MEKSYYAYVRPKYANRPWNLEKLPYGNSILSINEKMNIKPSSIIPFDTKVVDDLELSVKDGVFNLLPGTYRITLNLNIKTSAASDIMVGINKGKEVIGSVHASTLADTPVTIHGVIIAEVRDAGNTYSVLNNSSGPLTLLNGSIVMIDRI